MSAEVIDLVSLPDADDEAEQLPSEDDEEEDDETEEGSIYEFVIDGAPRTWKRPETHVRILQNPLRYIKNTTTPNKSRVKFVQESIKRTLLHNYNLTEQQIAEPIFRDGIIVVEMEFYWAPSLDYFIGKDRERGLRPEFLANHNWPDCKKPDVDNLAKLVLDAMQGIVFADDMKVTKLICAKMIDLVPPYQGRTVVWVKHCFISDLPRTLGNPVPLVHGLARRHIAPWR